MKAGWKFLKQQKGVVLGAINMRNDFQIDE